MIRRIFTILAIICCIPLYSVIAFADTTDSTTYGSGSYGDCNYGACPITLTSGSTVSTDVIPTASGVCTVQSDPVSVLTDSPDGYTMSFTTNTTNTDMLSGANSIDASAANESSPQVLAMNTWGYRVVDMNGFGSGATSSQTNGSIPSVTFAGVPASNGTPDVIAYSATEANPSVTTNVWYGVCANLSIPSGTYTVEVIYTAVIN